MFLKFYGLCHFIRICTSLAFMFGLNFLFFTIRFSIKMGFLSLLLLKALIPLYDEFNISTLHPSVSIFLCQ
ncbi:hypothetical protein QVD17_20296 [Tagetes erecta]|uniref:Uncharacterized protein n=1 Tax=Tagetes erecta TaxID=13708 RepID=A0AAD8KL00_TARER|nr:hypothetical protein QVD17_20296 [Tagetes erecta]